jgi:hypothetical protein
LVWRKVLIFGVRGVRGDAGFPSPMANFGHINMAGIRYVAMKSEQASTGVRAAGVLIRVALLAGLVAICPILLDWSYSPGNVDLDPHSFVQAEDTTDPDSNDLLHNICSAVSASRATSSPDNVRSVHVDALGLQNPSGSARHPLRAPPA